MKGVIVLFSVVSLLVLAGCGAQREQDKLCKFLHSCDSPEASE